MERGRAKPVVVALLALAIAVTIALVALFRSLNAIVERAIEHEGTRITETRVEVDRVRLALRDGRGTLEGLEVRNPSPFSSGDALRLGEITLDIDPGSVRGDLIVIELLQIRRPEISVVLDARGSSNLSLLRDRVEAYAPSRKGGASAGASGPRLRIERLVFEEAAVHVDGSALGAGTSRRALPSFTLENIGGTSGLPPDEIGKALLRHVLDRAVASIVTTELKERATEEIQRNVEEKGKGLLRSITE